MSHHSHLSNEMIRASAGSGKTFALSGRYLRLLFLGAKPENILATTFTRKASAEILHRILTRLAKAALDKSEAAKLGKELFGDTQQIDTRRVGELLARWAPHLSRWRVSTLDAFFLEMAGNIAWELGLPPGWCTEEGPEIERQIRQGVGLALGSKGDKSHHDEMIELLRLLFMGEATRSLSSEVGSLVRGLLSLYREAPTKAWERVSESKSHRALTDEELAEAIEALKNAPLPRKQPDKKKKETEGEPKVKAVEAREKILQHIGDEQWSKFLGMTIVQCVVQGNNKYDRSVLDDELVAAIAKLADHAAAEVVHTLTKQTVATRDMLGRVAESLDEIHRRDGIYGFGDITRILAEKVTQSSSGAVYRSESRIDHLLLDEFQDTSMVQWNILLPLAESIFADETTPLSSIALSSVAPSTPVFTDENSPPTPVLAASQRESRSESPTENDVLKKTFFCVGDTKQAIYEWRGGVAEIFDEVENTFPVVQKELDENYRSAPAVLDRVTDVFSNISENSVLQFPKRNSDDSIDKERAECQFKVVEDWKKGFHPPKPHHTECLGAVSLELAPHYTETKFAAIFRDAAMLSEEEEDFEGDSGEDSEETDSEDSSSGKDSVAERQRKTTYQYAAWRVKEIFDRHKAGTIGILVRRKETVGQMVRFLSHLKVAASQEAGVPLADSPAVQAILSVLRLAEHPGDTVAAFHLATIDVLAKRFEIDTQSFESAETRAKLSLRIRNDLITMGLAPFIRSLIVAIRPLSDAADRERLTSLLKWVANRPLGPTERIDRLIEAVRGMFTESVLAQRVRVMTLHKAKGLEFDIVVMPELDATIAHHSKYPKCLVNRSSATSPPDRILRHPTKPELPFFPEFHSASAEWYANETKAALNLLYVGMTRAKRELVMIVPPESKKKPPELKKDGSERKSTSNPPYSAVTLGNILIAALATVSPSVGNTDREILFEAGDKNWWFNDKNWFNTFYNSPH